MTFHFVSLARVQRLLHDSLGGNCRTIIVATIAPTAATLDETVSTLRFAGMHTNVHAGAREWHGSVTPCQICAALTMLAAHLVDYNARTHAHAHTHCATA
ncbi:hypothetical protein EON66_01930 [archaeon]|nr:MAG: hypothetical protein EON66_01930 [archaeon]